MEDVAYEDQVPRLEQFRAEHPEIEIKSPLENQGPFWKAYRDGMILSVQHDLRWLLDHLEQVK